MSFEEFQQSMESLKQRHDALTMNMELAWREIESSREKGLETDRRLEALSKLVEQDSANIRALARIAEAHQQRIEHLEG